MKKAYICPDMELVLFESMEAMMDNGNVQHSEVEPPDFDEVINGLPNSYVIDDNDFVNFKQ